MSTPEPKRDPRAPATQLLAPIEAVAQGQLECAIFLWFNYGNPAAIHTLAAAANGCYHALGKGHKGTPTLVEAWIKSLSEMQRVAARRAQNFFKHGPNRNDTKPVLFKPEHAEWLIVDSIYSSELLLHNRTPLMKCFYARFTFENPLFVAHLNAVRREEGRETLVVEDTGEWDRVEFLNKMLPAFRAAAAEN